MAKSKVSAEPVIKSWQEVDDAARDLAIAERTISSATAKINAKMEKLRQELAEATAADMVIADRLKRDIKDFAKANKSAFGPPGGGEKRSRALNHIVLGFRLSPAKLVNLSGWTWKKIAEALQAAKQKALYRTVVEANKEAIHEGYKSGNLDDAGLKDLGMKVEQADEFEYELINTAPQPTT
jgi:Pyruvate/2-oxoacid:ferredoxin oxidoreductase gamma subunit